MPIRTPKITAYGRFDPQTRVLYQRNPQRHILGWKNVISHVDWQNWSIGATRAHDEETRKTKKETLLYSGKWGICLDYPHRATQILFGMVGGLSAIVVHFKFHRLSGYWAVRGRNLADFGCSH